MMLFLLSSTKKKLTSFSLFVLLLLLTSSTTTALYTYDPFPMLLLQRTRTKRPPPPRHCGFIKSWRLNISSNCHRRLVPHRRWVDHPQRIIVISTTRTMPMMTMMTLRPFCNFDGSSLAMLPFPKRPKVVDIARNRPFIQLKKIWVSMPRRCKWSIFNRSCWSEAAARAVQQSPPRQR